MPKQYISANFFMNIRFNMYTENCTPKTACLKTFIIQWVIEIKFKRSCIRLLNLHLFYVLNVWRRAKSRMSDNALINTKFPEESLT